MFYRILADLVVAIHFAYVGYVVFGQLLILIGMLRKWGWIRNVWFRVSHALMILIVAGEAVAKVECPLTTWENRLLEASGQAANGHTFVGRILDDLMFFDVSGKPWLLPSIYYGFAGLVVLTLIAAPPRLRRTCKSATRDS